MTWAPEYKAETVEQIFMPGLVFVRLLLPCVGMGYYCSPCADDEKISASASLSQYLEYNPFMLNKDFLERSIV